MKLPSLSHLVAQTKETFLRFPLVIVVAFAGTFAMMRVIGFSREYYELHSQLWYNIVMTCSIGIPLTLSLAIFSESKGHSVLMKIVYQSAALVILLLFYFTLSPEMDVYDFIRYFIYLIAFHLLVSFTGYIFSNNTDYRLFWDFNLTIFLRFILSGLYSAVLYGGLAIALLAFDKLFDMHIDGKRYGQLFFFIAGVFNTWFFCSGVPQFRETEDTKYGYPKGLKIFTQYVLLPIIVVYVVILYLYLFKIIFQWKLPMGWVSNLVLGFSGAGIFSLLLIYPIKDEVRWMKIFTRAFFISLIPQILLLFLAITVRTNEYGITERRYYVFVLAIWLTVTTLYFIFTNFRNIKYIPISLFIIAVVTSVGPWSSFSVSMNSQMSRLEEVLKKNSILVDGKIVKAKGDLPDEEFKEIKSIVEFLNERGKLSKIQPWFNENLNDISSANQPERIKRGRNYGKEQGIMELMGLKSVKTEGFSTKKYLSIITKDLNSVSVKGYDNLYIYDVFLTDTSKKVYDSTGIKTEVSFNKINNVLSINRDSSYLNLNINPLIKKLDTETPELNLMTLDTANADFKTRFIIKNISADRNNDSLKVNSMQGYILIKKNE
jgi:hypothetical protein